MGLGLTRAHRVSYVGELGWELYTSADMSSHIYDAISQHGSDSHPIQHVGLHAMDSLRIEKAYRHYGHDIGPDDHVLEVVHLSVLSNS